MLVAACGRDPPTKYRINNFSSIAWHLVANATASDGSNEVLVGHAMACQELGRDLQPHRPKTVGWQSIRRWLIFCGWASLLVKDKHVKSRETTPDNDPSAIFFN